MKAATVRQPRQTPSYDDFPEPSARAGERLVTVSAAALSPLVRGRASGAHYSSGGDFPFVVGVDGVGKDESGRRVYFLLPRAPFGALAELTVAQAKQCLELPDDLDDLTAAAIANPGMSSWAALVERALGSARAACSPPRRKVGRTAFPSASSRSGPRAHR